MPDASGQSHHKLPPRWCDAFAALPLEAAPPQAWERLRVRLPAKPARPHRPLWLAAAAAMAAVAVLSMSPWAPHVPDRETRATGNPATSVTAPPSDATRPGQPDDAGSIALRMRERTALASRSSENDRQKPPASTTATGGSPHERTAAVARARAPHIAASQRARPEPGLEVLYAESAQLEALLAAARDDRIASSGAAALTDSLDAELAMIDATLVQPGLDAPRSVGLWRQRVDTLRQLAGIETTRRLLSARGETYDAALVSID